MATHPGYIVFGTGDPSYVVTKSILISTTNAEGASLVGVEDSGANYTGTDLETVLTEIADGTTLDSRYVNIAGDTMTGVLVITPTADGTSILNITQADTTTVFNVDTTNARVGIGTDSPDSAFHIKAGTSGTVGSHPAGQLIIQSPTDSVFSNAVITGYESDGDGNPDQQLWYLGSSSVGNSDIIFLNRRNSKLALGTSGISRITILGNGNVGINVTDPDTKLEVLHAGNQLKLSFDGTDNAIFAVDTAGDLTITPSGSNFIIPDAKNIVLNTTTGTKIGTATNQKLGFFNATPVVQQAYTAISDPPTQAEVVAIRDALVNLGLMATAP